jgi:hypothetical protein
MRAIASTSRPSALRDAPHWRRQRFRLSWEVSFSVAIITSALLTICGRAQLRLHGPPVA